MKNEKQPDFSQLKAVFINCTLKKSPAVSHTDGLMSVSRQVMENAGVKVETIRAIDHPIASGVYPDMTKHGWTEDAWTKISPKVLDADILVLGTPIWLGAKSSICNKIIERLYAHSGQVNDKGQYIFYGKAGGCIVTGNEDGVKACARDMLYALQHIGYTIPPQADAGWIGAIGPGPSYLDEDSGGEESEFTNRNTVFMSYNLMHMAKMLKDQGGIPAYGNQKSEWENGEKFGLNAPNPEYR
jgi:multimeric flavodoxin WrbA